jgi:hypothetical protein
MITTNYLLEEAERIREVLENKRQQLSLSFIEEDHIYFMKDLNGEVKSDYPSVSKVIKNFYEEFDKEAVSLRMSKGNKEKQQVLLSEWRDKALYATNKGSRVHYILEDQLIELYGGYKSVRKPIFECNEEQVKDGDAMVNAGNDFIDLMHERGAVLLDTEMVLGSNRLGYVGQPDKSWLVANREQTDYGIVITDWKTNKPSSFVPKPYTKTMLPPFDYIDDTALGHYYMQLPSYGKLLIDMLSDTEFRDKKMLGYIIVHLDKYSQFTEYRVPTNVANDVFNTKLV